MLPRVKPGAAGYELTALPLIGAATLPTTLCVATLLLLALPHAASAEVADLEAARAMVERQEYEAGAEAMQRALQSGTLSPEQLVVVYRGLAECAAALRRPDQARDAFQRLLVIDPDHFVASTESPLIREPFEQAQAHWQQSPPPRISYEPPETIPAGEALSLDIELDATTVPGIHDSVRLHLRHPEGHFVERNMPGGELVIPAALCTDVERIQFFLSVHDEYGNVSARVGSEEEPLVVLVGEAERENDSRTEGGDRPWYRRWWVWTIVGAVVLGVAIGVPAGVAASASDDPCVQTLGGPCNVTIDYDRE